MTLSCVTTAGKLTNETAAEHSRKVIRRHSNMPEASCHASQVVLSGTGVGGYGLVLCKLAIPCSRTVAVSQNDVGHPGVVDAGLRFLSDSFSRLLGWGGGCSSIRRGRRVRASTSQSSTREARQIAPVKGLSAQYSGELDSKCYRKVASNRQLWYGYRRLLSRPWYLSGGQPFALKFSPHTTCILKETIQSRQPMALYV